MLMNQKTRLPAYIQEEIDRVKGIYYPVKASLPRRVLQRYAACRKIHPNTEDEFCNPDIGPNYGIISGYQKDYMRYSGNPSREDLNKLALKKYAETVHIDRDSVLRTRRDSRECTEIRLENASPTAWSGAVMDAIRQLQGE